ncbi:MAG TPA: hypothetical protein VF472_14700 [Burkholderiaceae bacterium]
MDATTAFATRDAAGHGSAQLLIFGHPTPFSNFGYACSKFAPGPANPVFDGQEQQQY